MTPIFDLRGNIIAFGGRVLDDSKPKYVNSPETLVYRQRRIRCSHCRSPRRVPPAALSSARAIWM